MKDSLAGIILKTVKRSYYLTSIDKWRGETRGWFFGQFIDKGKFPELNSDQVEIAWKKFDEDYSESAHTHKIGTEISIVLSGKWRVKVEGKQLNLKKGDILVVYPETVLENILIPKGSEAIIIKSPSVPDDKFISQSSPD